MPLNHVKVALAVQSGLSTVCATCQKYWDGRDKGLEGDRCTSTKPCGSPLVGDDFHAYEGPMTAFDQWCFICGEPPAAVIAKPGSKRRFGVCARHKAALPSMTPVNMTRKPGTDPLVHIGGETRTLQNLLPPRKKTVWERIEETEAEFAEMNRERGLLEKE